MMYKIKVTDQADIDIRNIYEYIAYELQSPENARGQLDRIEKYIMRVMYGGRDIDTQINKYTKYEE